MTATVSQPAMRVRRALAKLCMTSRAAGKQKQRDEREGQRKAEDDLREDEDAERVEAGGDDGDGRDDGDEAAQEDGELDVEEALDDDLAGHDADGGEERPEQSSATAKTTAAARPKSGPRVWYAS